MPALFICIQSLIAFQVFLLYFLVSVVRLVRCKKKLFVLFVLVRLVPCSSKRSLFRHYKFVLFVLFVAKNLFVLVRLVNQKGKNMSIIFHKECYKIKKACIQVRKELGNGFLEKVYEEALEIELQQLGFLIETQKKIDVFYKGNVVGKYCADIVVNGKIIIELKCASKIVSAHRAQMLNYLRATGMKLGLLINFPNDSRGFTLERVPNLRGSEQNEQ